MMKLDNDQKIMFKDLKKNYNSEHFNYAQLLPACTGAGKSIIAIHLIKYFNDKIKPFIICPKTLIPMWEKLLKDANVEPIFITTYNTLAGTKQNGCNHPYLKRTENGYRVTKEWKKLNGVFLICDESQAIKNKKSARHWASFTLISNNTNGKVLHLTASAIDKKDNWLCLYRNLGIVTKKQLIVYHNKSYHYSKHGLGEIFDIVKQHDKKLYNTVLEKYDIKSKTILSILSYLWINFFMEKYIIKVIDPIYKDLNGRAYEKKVCNYFATLDEHGLKLLGEEVDKLKRHSKGNLENYIRHNVGQVQLFLMRLCEAKLGTLIRLTKNKLKEKHRKVIICCPYIESQEFLMTKLFKYNPLLLNGKTKNRQEIVNLFNEPNDNHRCLIMTPQVGGVGLSMQDIHGKFPRTMYIIPTYDFQGMCQCPGRIYRRGLKSDTECYILYSNDGLIENIIINILAKTKIISSILIEGSGRVYPGDYPYEIEDDDGVSYEDLKKNLDNERGQV